MKRIQNIILLTLLLVAFIAQPVWAANTNSALLVRATSQYFNAGDSVSLDIESDNLTIDMWVKLSQLPSTAGGKMTLLSKGGAYDFYIDVGNKLNFSYTSNGTTVFTDVISDSAFFVSDDVGVWVHIATTCVASNKDALLWKNGSEVASTPTLTGGGAATFWQNSYDVTIGANITPMFYLDASIDEVRISDNIRYTETFTPQTEEFSNDADTMALWHLNNSVADSSSNGNTLTNNNSATFPTDVPFGEAIVVIPKRGDIIIFE